MQTRRVKYVLWLVGIVAALLIIWFLWLSKGTPPGQPPLTSLTRSNLDQFKNDFNGVGDEARLVLLLSPTWPTCLRGASAIEKLLEQKHALPIRVLVVWEPILPTDWSQPSGMVQSRISDARVIQYWDHDHLVAGELRQQLSSEPSCCQRSGVLWDFAMLYGKQAQWGTTSPIFADGTVVEAAPTLRKRLASLSDSTTGHWNGKFLRLKRMHALPRPQTKDNEVPLTLNGESRADLIEHRKRRQ